MSGFLLRLRRDRAPRLGKEREQEACETRDSRESGLQVLMRRDVGVQHGKSMAL